MKVLKSEQVYKYADFQEMQCGICKKKLWDKGEDIITTARIQCPGCSAVFTFEPTRWRVLADLQEE